MFGSSAAHKEFVEQPRKMNKTASRSIGDESITKVKTEKKHCMARGLLLLQGS